MLHAAAENFPAVGKDNFMRIERFPSDTERIPKNQLKILSEITNVRQVTAVVGGNKTSPQSNLE